MDRLHINLETVNYSLGIDHLLESLSSPDGSSHALKNLFSSAQWSSQTMNSLLMQATQQRFFKTNWMQLKCKRILNPNVCFDPENNFIHTEQMPRPKKANSSKAIAPTKAKYVYVGPTRKSTQISYKVMLLLNFPECKITSNTEHRNSLK